MRAVSSVILWYVCLDCLGCYPHSFAFRKPKPVTFGAMPVATRWASVDLGSVYWVGYSVVARLMLASTYARVYGAPTHMPQLPCMSLIVPWSS